MRHAIKPVCGLGVVFEQTLQVPPGLQCSKNTPAGGTPPNARSGQPFYQLPDAPPPEEDPPLNDEPPPEEEELSVTRGITTVSVCQ